jgi:hypothetical protein
MWRRRMTQRATAATGLTIITVLSMGERLENPDQTVL